MATVHDVEWHRPGDTQRLQHELRRLERTVREQGQVTAELADRILALSLQVAVHSDQMRREHERRMAEERARFLRSSNWLLYGTVGAAFLTSLFLSTRSRR